MLSNSDLNLGAGAQVVGQDKYMNPTPGTTTAPQNPVGPQTPIITPTTPSPVTPPTTSTTGTPAPVTPPAPTAPTPSVSTITTNDGNTFTVDATGQIISGASAGKYRVGSNINDYSDSTYLKSLLSGAGEKASVIAQGNAEQVAIEDERKAGLNTLNNTIAGYQNGSIPLNASEQAQVDALKATWQTTIDQQAQINNAAGGQAKLAAARMGGGTPYDTSSIGNVASVVSAGVNKINNLNIQMLGAVAALTDALKAKDIASAKDAYERLNAFDKERSETIQKNIKDANDAIKDAQKKIEDAKKEQQTLVDKASTAMQDAIKGGADSATIAKMREAAAKGDLQSVLTFGAPYLQTSSNPDIAKYLQYKKDMISAGLESQALPYDAWQAKEDKRASALKGSEAYATGYGTAAGKAAAEKAFGVSGDGTAQNIAEQLVNGNLAPAELTKRATKGSDSYNAILKAADDYSLKTTGKRFNIAQADRDYKFANNVQTQNTLNFLKSLTGTDDGSGNLTGGNLDELRNISDSIGRTNYPALNNAKAWAKLAMGDPKYAEFQATATEVADQVAKILQGSASGGTSDAKLQQAVNMFQTGFSQAQITGIIGALKPLLRNRGAAMISDNPYLSDYASDLGIKTNTAPKNQQEEAIKMEQDAQNAIIEAGKINTSIQPTVRSMLNDGKSYAEIKEILGIQ